MRRIHKSSWVFVAGLLLAGSTGSASAQVSNIVKPEFLFVVDTSSSMTDEAPPNSCNFTGDLCDYFGCGSGGTGPRRIDAAACVLRNVMDSTGDAVFGLETFNVQCGGSGYSAGPDSGCGALNCQSSFPSDFENVDAGSTDADFPYSWYGCEDGGVLWEPLNEANAYSIRAWGDGEFTACGQTPTPPSTGGDDLTEAAPPGPSSLVYTPLAGSLRTAGSYLRNQLSDPSPYVDFNGTGDPDPIPACRPVNVVLLTDGDEYCEGGAGGAEGNQSGAVLNARNLGCMRVDLNGDGDDDDPGEYNQDLNGDGDCYDDGEQTAFRVRTYVIRFGDVGSTCNNDNVEDIAEAGGVPLHDVDCPNAGVVSRYGYYATNEDEISAAINDIIADSALVERCNGEDDDCDSAIDEDFDVDQECTVGVGACERDGVLECVGDFEVGCSASPGGESSEDCSNGVDDDCDGRTDCRDDDCSGTDICDCVPFPEICDGLDNDCDQSVDESDLDDPLTRECGSALGVCSAGTQTCQEQGSETGSPQWSSCSGGTSPPEDPETSCDGQDNDCDGGVDEGLFQPCGTNEGVCQPGQSPCVHLGGGSYGYDPDDCRGEIPPGNEVCDGLDNDCDGTPDDGNPGGGAACGSDLGACNSGQWTCVTPPGELQCVGATGPTQEICDGVDNDCDGAVDNGVDGVGETCSQTMDGTPISFPSSPPQGVCRTGTTVCMGASGIVCQGAVGPSDEICDGYDNDCDGTVDEDVPPRDCGSDAFECTQGTQQCQPQGSASGQSMWSECSGDVPVEEQCNGADDDCDGEIDEGLNVGGACGTDVGECQVGINACVDGNVECTDRVGPEDEVCDGLDNDCDGSVDEGLPIGEACGEDVGLCMPGNFQCIQGDDVCVGQVPPSTEVCDCDDNDCDGSVDEGAEDGSLCPGGSQCVDCQCAVPCMPPGEFGSRCPTGKAAKMIEDTGECFCVAERCNDQACGEETIEREGEMRCAPGRDDLSPCVCKNNECTFPCEGVTCGDGTVCNPRDPLGRCVEDSCRGLGCTGGEVCNPVTGECEADACADVECEEDEACRSGECETSCAEVSCGDGERCKAGSCVDDPCAGVSCGAGEVCEPEDGSCIEDQCAANIVCPAGSRCDPASGDCETDPCLFLHCPDEQVCREGECARPDSGGGGSGGSGGGEGGSGGSAGEGPPPDDKDRVVATGGGGCACAITPEHEQGRRARSALLVLLALAGFVLLQRQRVAFARRQRFQPVAPGCGRPTRGTCRVRPARAGRVLAMIGITVAMLGLAGCDVDPFCLDCVDAGVAGSDAGPDGGPGGSGGSGGGGVVGDGGPGGSGGAGGSAGEDGGTSLPDAGEGCTVGADEVCDERDNDCDGRVDEGLDLQSNPDHCGACGNACAPEHAFGSCVQGRCELDSCDVGWHDLDQQTANGCEYRCIPSTDDDALCNQRDDDCDGEIDEDVDLSSDMSNCGSCGRTCSAPKANNICDDGECALDPDDPCEDGFHDVDGVRRNGCEYACTSTQPATEACDGRDNDCDGEIDEQDPQVGERCGSDQGECTAGSYVCENGNLRCEGETTPQQERCNGLDDDCDDVVDEEVAVYDERIGQACSTDVGECVPGERVCVDGAIECSGGVRPADEEICNGLDDDCDDSVDEEIPPGANCGNGICATQLICSGGFTVCPGASNAMPEVCGNGDDDDCDGNVDEGFDLENDINNCGTCGRQCADQPHAVVGCEAGECTILGCELGYHDLDAGEPGCEYACDYRGEQELCNDIDEDCDGAVDEGFSAPASYCPTGGECGSNPAVTCENGALGCEYGGGDVELDPDTGRPVPVETLCDGRDNDCDGAVDESYPSLGDGCDTGASGACGEGEVRCRDDASGTECVQLVEPGADDELCDGLDNDCNGEVDDMPLDSFWVEYVPGEWIMQYEASRPDATAGEQGSASSRACSTPDVLPWTMVTVEQARQACEAIGSGVTLCDETAWELACEAGNGCGWSYASNCNTYQSSACNGVDRGSETLLPTGASNACYADWSTVGVYDMSGNVKELTAERGSGTGRFPVRGGAYTSLAHGLRCDFDWAVVGDDFAFVNAGFRCCYSGNNPPDTPR